VTSVAYSPDGSKLAAAYFLSVAIFNVETNEVQCTVTGHQGLVYGVSFDPKGKILASCSQDKTVRLRDASTWAPVGLPLRVGRPINSVAFSPDGKSRRSWRRRLRTNWRGANLQSINRCPCREPVAGALRVRQLGCLLPDGQFIASCSGDGYQRDNSVRVWHVETGEQLCQSRGHTADNEQCTCQHYDQDGGEE